MGNRAAVTTPSLLLSTFFIALPSSSVGTCAVNVSEPMTWLLMEGGYYGLSNNHVTSLHGARCLCTSWKQTRVALQDAAFDLGEVANYLTKHHLSEKFWVDAARSSDSGSYWWANGCPLSPDSSVWAVEVGGPGGADCVVLSNGTRDKMALSPATCDNTSARALCQTVIPPDIFAQVPSAVNFTWVTLGSPGQQYGFSNTKMYFNAARQTCAGLPGVTRLASLDKHFQDVVQYIFHNYPDRQYWVDCTRVDKRNPFSWGNGASVNESFWEPQEPGPTDLLARLTIKTHDVRLAGMSGQEKDCFVLCERTLGPSAVTLEWTALGSPLCYFGFSNSSTDFVSAKQTCAQQLGNVSLVSLHQAFDGVHQYLKQIYPDRQYWVDATRSGSTFVWGDGSSIDSLLWGENEPQPADDGAVLSLDQGEMRLAGQLQTSEYFFLCEGSPGVHTDPSQVTQFPTGCSRTEDVVSMETQRPTATSVISSPVVNVHPSPTEGAGNLLELVTSSVTMAASSLAVTLPTPSVSPPSSLAPTAVTWDANPEMTSHPPDPGSRFTVTADYGDSSIPRSRPVSMSLPIHLSVSDAQYSVLPSPSSSDAQYSVLPSPSSSDAQYSVLPSPSSSDAQYSVLPSPSSSDAQYSVLPSPSSSDAQYSVLPSPSSSDAQYSVLPSPSSSDAQYSVLPSPSSSDAQYSVLPSPSSSDAQYSVLPSPSSSDAQYSVLPSPSSSDARYSMLRSLSLFDFEYSVLHFSSLSKLQSAGVSGYADNENSRQHGQWDEAGAQLLSRSSDLVLNSADWTNVPSGDILSGLRTSLVHELVSDDGSRSIVSTSSSTFCSSLAATDHRSPLVATESSLNGDFLTNSLKKDLDFHGSMASLLAATPPLHLASATADDGNGRLSSTSQHISDTSSWSGSVAPSSSLSTTSNSLSHVVSAGGHQAARQSRCQCVHLKAVLSNIPLDYKTESIKQELLLDHRNLSATIRRLTSAQDWRPTAVVSGLAAILTLSVVAAVIIVPDLHGLVRSLVAAARR